MTVDSRRIVSNLLGLVGAILGGTVGYYTFRWIVGQGFYALILPGALLGLGCGMLSRHPSTTRGVLCGIAALVLGVLAECSSFRLDGHDDVYYTVTHIFREPPITLIMLGLGGFFAFWLGKDAGFIQSAFGRGAGRPRDGEKPGPSV
ncbi:hypothetical protein [Aquisphaera insulae]|uniref:hypothetical protein n=1 Tax=Aquisphaera insulae TaxID=2712864 RepID=UPI0013ECB22B|nr:hypothetical protein [Aquisphaera insulae]